MNIGKIEGGTNAGWRTVRDVPKENWTCSECGKSHRYYWVSCPVDGTPRPEK